MSEFISVRELGPLCWPLSILYLCICPTIFSWKTLACVGHTIFPFLENQDAFVQWQERSLMHMFCALWMAYHCGMCGLWLDERDTRWCPFSIEGFILYTDCSYTVPAFCWMNSPVKHVFCLTCSYIRILIPYLIMSSACTIYAFAQWGQNVNSHCKFNNQNKWTTLVMLLVLCYEREVRQMFAFKLCYKFL